MSQLALNVNLDELIENLNTEEQLKELDALIIRNGGVECPLFHKFCNNQYIREIFVPVNTLFTTFTHKTEHPFFASIGEFLMWENGKGWVHVQAPCTGITDIGSKRIVFTLTDVVFTTIHYNPTNTQDTEELHDMLFEKYENEKLSLQELKSINVCQQLSQEQQL